MKNESMYLSRWRKILYLKPYYRAGQASGTIVCYEDGSQEKLPHGCRQVVMMLAKKFFITVELAHSRSEMWLGGTPRRKLPLVLHEQFCLVPIKFREENQRNDGTLGYIVLHKFRSVSQHPVNGSYLQFRKMERQEHIPQNYATVHKQIDLARFLLDCYLEEQQGGY